MQSMALAFILILASVSTAQAGAWLRSKGGGFASSSFSMNQDKEISGSIYLEYGLTDKRTLGADISYGVARTGAQEGSAIVFLRMPLSAPDKRNKFAAQFGLGTRILNGEFYAAAEAGLSWGRGIQITERYGWVNVDSSVNITQSPATNRIKIDGTAGLSLTDHTKVMLQVFNTFQDGDLFTKVAPSLLISPGKSNTTLQLSAEFSAVGGGAPAVKLGIWREW